MNKNTPVISRRLSVALVPAMLAVLLALVLGLSADARRKVSQKTPNTPKAFSQYVLDIAEKEYPDLKLSATNSPFLLQWKGEGQISLDNLYKQVRNNKGQPGMRDSVVRFLNVLTNVPPPEEELKTWEEARTRVRPQIFPRDYLKEAELKQKMVFKPLAFSNELMEGYVIDSENAFRYLLKSDLSRWKVSLETVKKAAYDNLGTATASTKLASKLATGDEARGKYLVIAVNDGYAAARLLLPAVRNQIETELGKPCYVAIPNRDCLIAWSYDCNQEKQFENQVIRKFHFQDHPLSPEVYALVNSKIEKKDSIAPREKKPATTEDQD